MKNIKVIICADATPQMGSGHVMRSLALAFALKNRGWQITFAGKVSIPWVKEKLSRCGISFKEISGTPEKSEDPYELLEKRLECEAPDWIVFDGYHFGPDCQKFMLGKGIRVLVIDDCAYCESYHCDLLLNQNPCALSYDYKGEIGQMLAGAEYALLRPEFLNARPSRNKYLHAPENVLLCLGGGDFSFHLPKIAEILRIPEFGNIKLSVVAGVMPVDKIQAAFGYLCDRLNIIENPENMAALYAGADFCVTAGGSSCWELCHMGTPFLTWEVADNQKDILKWLAEKGLARPLGRDSLKEFIMDNEARFQAVLLGEKLVDGKGAARVCGKMSGGN